MEAQDTTTVPLSRIRDDFNLDDAATALSFCAENGLPRGMHRSHRGHIVVPACNYDAFVAAVRWAGKPTDVPREAA